jgi:hypothetical protein
MNDNVRSAVVDSQVSLGKLEPWEKRLFDEEVVPQSQKFVKDYTGASVVVDTELIRSFLRFYAPKVFHAEAPKILVLVRAAPACEECQQSRPRIVALVRQRLERRGFVASWVTAEEAEQLKGSFKVLNDRVVALSQAQGLNAALTVLVEPVPVDDLDSAHADERRFYIQAELTLKDIGHPAGKLEILDSESFEGTVARLLNESFTETGQKLVELPSKPGTSDRKEVQIEVSGLNEYSIFARARDTLAERLRSEGPLEERKVARGKAVFALVTNKPPEEIRKQLGEVSLGGARLLPAKDSSGEVIQLEVRR